jgi:hypothetical protein
MWFWSAFVKTLEDGKRRWILESRYTDQTGGDPPVGSLAEVLPSDIKNPGAEAPVNTKEVTESIEKWSDRTGVPLARFLLHPGLPSLQREHTRPKLLLDLTALDRNDLERILIPLDIVLKLTAKT